MHKRVLVSFHGAAAEGYEGGTLWVNETVWGAEERDKVELVFDNQGGERVALGTLVKVGGAVH